MLSVKEGYFYLAGEHTSNNDLLVSGSSIVGKYCRALIAFTWNKKLSKLRQC